MIFGVHQVPEYAEIWLKPLLSISQYQYQLIINELNQESPTTENVEHVHTL